MTESQIKYIYEHHKKYLSIYFGITEQAVFKWGQRVHIPEKYKKALFEIDLSCFFDVIKNHQIGVVGNKINADMQAVLSSVGG